MRHYSRTTLVCFTIWAVSLGCSSDKAKTDNKDAKPTFLNIDTGVKPDTDTATDTGDSTVSTDSGTGDVVDTESATEIVACEGDRDSDGICDENDPCPDDIYNDQDGDGVCDSDDICPLDNPNDSDGDGVCDSDDPCPNDSPDDFDGDGICTSEDVCPLDNPNDPDGDGICAFYDSCPLDFPDDIDGDGVCNSDDTCPFHNPDDPDGDGTCGDYSSDDTFCDDFERECGFDGTDGPYYDDMDDCKSDYGTFTALQRQCAAEHIVNAKDNPDAKGFHCTVASFNPTCVYN